MIPLIEINTGAARSQVAAEVIEKDYVICWILNCISKSELANDFIFYGGTALKRVYFEEQRFSEDIDLISERSFGPDELLHRLVVCFEQAKILANLLLEIDSRRVLSQGSRTQIFVRYDGYDEIVGAPKEVRIDLAMKMDIVGESARKKIRTPYSDLADESGFLNAQTLDTILANKLGMLMDSSRKEPRDLYDIWFLLKRVHQFSFNREKVRKFFREKYGFFPSAVALKPHIQNRLYEERWQTRLAKQVANLPPIKTITSEIEQKLDRIFK